MNFLSRLFGPLLQNLSAQEVNEKLKSGKRPILVDVRESQEYASGHIAGAKLIPLGELPRRMKELSKDKELICFCATGSRSRSATRMLVAAGFNVFNADGGMFAWRRAGLPVNKA